MEKIYLYLFSFALFAFIGSIVMIIRSMFKADGKTKKYSIIAIVSLTVLFISMAFINSGAN